jgi:hypothetical protein
MDAGGRDPGATLASWGVPADEIDELLRGAVS